ncbi:MAG: hypothetical protein Q9222_006048, partial [Ikaeria aurantiellina]
MLTRQSRSLKSNEPRSTVLAQSGLELLDGRPSKEKRCGHVTFTRAAVTSPHDALAWGRYIDNPNGRPDEHQRENPTLFSKHINALLSCTPHQPSPSHPIMAEEAKESLHPTTAADTEVAEEGQQAEQGGKQEVQDYEGKPRPEP